MMTCRACRRAAARRVRGVRRRRRPAGWLRGRLPFRRRRRRVMSGAAGDVAPPRGVAPGHGRCGATRLPVLRGGARLNRIREHEVVPPHQPPPGAAGARGDRAPPSPTRGARSPRPRCPAARPPLGGARSRRRRRRPRGGATEETRASTRATRTRKRSEESGDGVHSQTSRSSESPSDKARISRTWRRAPRRRWRRWCTSPGSRAAARVWGDANALAQTIASAAAACGGLLPLPARLADARSG